MIDWDDLRYLLAVARGGTMSEAARTLKVAQPTVGRRISAFERRLGARLFVRSPDGLSLTPSGQHLRARAERMEREALAAEAVASGRDAGLSGRVRITASEWVVRSVLGPAIVPLLERYPDLSVDLVADVRRFDLARGEADIALRPSRFEQPDVFQQQIATLEFALYASEVYLEQRGVPDFENGGAGSTLIAMSVEIDGAWLRSVLPHARVAARVNGREAMATMAAAGLGIAYLPRILGDRAPGLRLLRTPIDAPRRKLYLGAHRSSRTIPRVKATLAFLVTIFESYA